MNNQPVFSLIAEEDESILAERHRAFDKRRQGLWPSEASVAYQDGKRKVVLGKCHRQVFYRTNDIPKSNPGGIKLHQTGRIGKQLERMQIKLWKEMGLWVSNNVKFFNKELVLSGEMDAILRNPMTGKLMGIEMKTYAEYPNQKEIHGVKREKETGRFIAGQPKESHFLQALLYAWEYKDVLDEYRIFYMDRASGARVEFKVGFQKRNDGKHQCYWQQIPGPYWNAFQEGPSLQPFTIEDMHGRYKELIKILRKKTLPKKEYMVEYDAATVERLYSEGKIAKGKYERWVKNPNAKSNKLGDWHCAYCDWKDQCATDG
jgi:hypothetical protein